MKLNTVIKYAKWVSRGLTSDANVINLLSVQIKLQLYKYNKNIMKITLTAVTHIIIMIVAATSSLKCYQIHGSNKISTRPPAAKIQFT